MAPEATSEHLVLPACLFIYAYIHIRHRRNPPSKYPGYGPGLVMLQPSSCRHGRNLMWPIRSVLFIAHICVMWYNYIAVCLTDVSILLSDPWCLKIVFLGDNLMVAAILSDLFNKSLITGTLPTAWKFARVVPIPKSGSSKDSANYRPISILTVISKLLEKTYS